MKEKLIDTTLNDLYCSVFGKTISELRKLTWESISELGMKQERLNIDSNFDSEDYMNAANSNTVNVSAHQSQITANQ